MENYPYDLEPNEERDLSEREDRCQKALRTVTKAIVMRLIICGILIWVILSSGLELWVSGLLVLVMLINLTGILPLVGELKKRRKEWRSLLEEET